MANPYQARKMTGDEAVKPIRSGQHIFVGSGAAEPQVLVRSLAARASDLIDTEILHLMTLGVAPYAEDRFAGRLRHNALFIGSNVRGAVERGLADYTPSFLHEIPSFMRSGRLPVDVALIAVSPCEDGYCSLGVAVDIIKAAVEVADYVVAQVNPKMPRTYGDSLVSASDIDAFVDGKESLPELPVPEMDPAALWIGRYVAALIEDGATLQLGIGAIPNAVLAVLQDKKDLGVHSEMVSDGVLPLLDKKIITGRRKSLHPGKVVVSFCLGSKKLYEAVNRNPLFEFYPTDYVNCPEIVSRNDRMVAVNSALQIDLSGQVAADSIGHRFYSGFGGQVDFVRGAARSKGGKSVIALSSTAKNGTVSRIVPALIEGTGVVTTRADVDFVVTEYGIASLKGRTVRERAISLIQISHPRFREQLLAKAKAIGYLDAGHVLPTSAGPYAIELETRKRFDDTEVFFRPVRPSDERRLKDLFYSQSPETTYRRFGAYLKSLSEKQFQELVAMDYQNSMAIAGFVREGRKYKMIAVGQYKVHPGERFAESLFNVHDSYQGFGIGSFLLNYLSWIAKERHLEGFKTEIPEENPRMERIFRRYYVKVDKKILKNGDILIIVKFADWKKNQNPAKEE